MDKSLEKKLANLRRSIRRLDGAVVAFAGGSDSTFLLRICREELGENAVAVTSTPKNYPKAELAMAKRIAKVVGAKHVTFEDEDEEPKKFNYYSNIKGYAMRSKLQHVLDASHKDDDEEQYLAAQEAGVKSPLLESDLTKAEIQLLSKELGIPNIDIEPSSEKIIAYLRRIGIKDVQVTIKGQTVHLVANKTGLVKLSKSMGKIIKKLRLYGFNEVLLKSS